MKEKHNVNIKRVIIELEDGTIIFDGKPDLLSFVISIIKDSKVNVIGCNYSNEKTITSKMVYEQIRAVEKLLPNLAIQGIVYAGKEEKEKVND